MAENKVKLFIGTEDTRCGCFPKMNYQPVREEEYMKKTDIKVENANDKEEYMKKTDIKVENANDKEEYMKKTDIKVENATDRGEYVKRGEAKINDLSEEDKRQLNEDAVLQSKIDGTDITWKKLLQETSSDIDTIKRFYLQKQKKFNKIWKYYDNDEQLNSLQEKKLPTGIDTIRKENGEEIKTEQLSNELILKIKNAKDDNRPYVDLYDETKKGKNKLVSGKGYNLSKINSYKVALVIPNALLSK